MRDNYEFAEAARILAKNRKECEGFPNIEEGDSPAKKEALRKLTCSVMTPITDEERIKMDIKALDSHLNVVEHLVFDGNWQYVELEEALIKFRRVMDVVLKRHNVQ